MADLNNLHRFFVAHLPEMQRMAESHFRCLDPDKREEATQNTLALVWKFLYALLRQGRNPEIWKSVVWYAIKQTKSGRMPQGQPKAKDAYECRRRGRVRFESVDLNGLIGRKTPVFDQVVFRVDVRRFLGTLKPHNQVLACDLATGMTTTEAAVKYRVTPGAIAQFRSRFKRWHDEFFAE
jgi:hypothetical protein